MQPKGIEDCASNRPDRISGRNSQCSSNLDEPMESDKSNRHGSKWEGGDIPPLFAPTACDFKAWKRILDRREDLQPEFFGLDDGLANRMERTRAAGNGVVSLAAAYAYVTLRAAFEK